MKIMIQILTLVSLSLIAVFVSSIIVGILSGSLPTYPYLSIGLPLLLLFCVYGIAYIVLR